ncbi:MAG: hypothetical protein GF417_10990 [Candidatus Latescibacteria bacterium]|nr:hypothetical protein [bacterium]MBD3424951.1 hypothetical protein [Candidatus Latescibacterota bacterium]
MSKPDTILTITVILLSICSTSVHAGKIRLQVPRPVYTPLAAGVDTLRLSDFQVRKLREEGAPVTYKAYIMEMLIGTLYGSGAGLISGVAAAGSGNIGVAIIGFAAGYTVGSSFGVYQVGTSADRTGSFTATLTGSVVGGLLSAWIFGSNNEVAETLEWGSLILPPLGGCIGFNLTRRHKTRQGGIYNAAGPSMNGRGHLGKTACHINLIDLRF